MCRTTTMTPAWCVWPCLTQMARPLPQPQAHDAPHAARRVPPLVVYGAPYRVPPQMVRPYPWPRPSPRYSPLATRPVLLAPRYWAGVTVAAGDGAAVAVTAGVAVAAGVGVATGVAV